MPSTLRLFDLFGPTDLAGALRLWPSRVQPVTGVVANWPPSSLNSWLAALNNSVEVYDVRGGALEDRVGVQATLRYNGTAAGYPSGFPFVFGSMPDVEFRIQTMPATARAWIFVSFTDAGAELVLEGLPVEIRLPAGLFEPHPSEPPVDVTVGTFTPGKLDSFSSVLRANDSTSVFVHLRISMNADGEFTIRSSLPISFGKCTFTGLPCLGVHGFELLPSPGLAMTEAGWIRHPVGPWSPELSGPVDGAFMVRTVDPDPSAEPFKGLADWLHGHSGDENPALAPDQTVTHMVAPVAELQAGDPTAEFVLDDLVCPWYFPYDIPIPWHVTIGLRRRITDPHSSVQVYGFSRAPVRAYFSREPLIGFIVESIFFRTMPKVPELTFEAGITFGGNSDDRGHSGGHALLIALEDQYTVSVAYHRDLDPATRLPATASALDHALHDVCHWQIARIAFDIVGFRLGYSLGRGVVEKASFGDSAEATIDLWISSPPSDPTDAVQLKSLSGENVGFAIQGLGWRLGSLQFSNANSPDGVVILLFGKWGIIIQELGLAAEQGAPYLVISGGLMVALPSGCEGGFTLRRLRFRLRDVPGAPFLRVDGFFFFVRWPAGYLEAGGYYTERDEGPTHIQEFGLTGSAQFSLGPEELLLGLDLLVGYHKSPDLEFHYLFVQVFYHGTIPITLLEFRGFRLLFARNMQPSLQPVDQDAHELRYYNWYKSTNPLLVPGDRRLAAWKARDDSLAIGVGAAASVTLLGSLCELGVFILFVTGPDDKGLLFVAEIMLLRNPKPVAYAAIEWDIKNGRLSAIIGVELTVRNIVPNAPAWTDKIAKLTGTLYISNDPCTLAIGRLSDERTWLQYRIDIDLWIRTFVMFGACLELVENGPKGGGFVFRWEGGINAGIVKVTYNVGFGFVMAFFSTGSVDYSLVVWVDGGVRIILFGFLRFGLSAHAELRIVGAHPTRVELSIEFRLETPWFLPDVTWTMQIDNGEIRVADLGSATSPLLASGATEGKSQQRAPIHSERARPENPWNGTGPAPTFSINDLRQPGSAEADRLARFAGNAELRPVSTDSTVAVSFTVAVNDQIGFGSAQPGLGKQSSGDLALVYDLIGLAIRRRARFGSDKNWYLFQDRSELPADFSDPAGVGLTGSYDPGELNVLWDVDVKIEGKVATKQLLINARTPFEFATSNPRGDAQLVTANPDWPCCHSGRKKWHYTIHEITYRNNPPGRAVEGMLLFTESSSRFFLLRPACARPSASDPTCEVAVVTAYPPGIVARAELDEDAAYCFVTLSVPRLGRFELRAFDLQGNVVGNQIVPPVGDFQTVTVSGSGPIRRLEFRCVAGPVSQAYAVSLVQHMVSTLGASVLELDRVSYISLREYLSELRETAACDDTSGTFSDAYQGRAKLFFLANHEYEISLRTRLTGSHPSVADEQVEVTEYLYFRTKGLPGLNAVSRVGEELEPYVRSRYPAAGAIVYREEPVALALQEDYSIALPLTARPAGTSQERTTLIRMQLAVCPNVATDNETPFTTTSPDWIVTHRVVPADVFYAGPWMRYTTESTHVATAMLSIDPFKLRLAALTQRPTASCLLPDPRDVSGAVLIAPPQGATDPLDPSRQLWPAATGYNATVHLENAPTVDRAVFDPADLTALTFGQDGAMADPGAWSIVNGRVVTSDGGRRFALFGESDWNYVTIELNVVLEGAAVGVGVALPAAAPPGLGLFAMIESTGAGRRLALYRRSAPSDWTQLATQDLPMPPDPAAPMTFTVTAFDDRLRAAVGDIVVEADRDENREGRIALVAEGRAKFAALRVRGLTLYRFPFQTSKYASFGDHIQSWPGTLNLIETDSLGAGTTGATVAAVLAINSAAMTAAMAPTAEAADREAAFQYWVQTLGLPLRDEVKNLELSRFAIGGQTGLFLLESPEPLDFTNDITVTLSRRIRVPGHHIPDWTEIIHATPFSVQEPAHAPLNPMAERIKAVRDRVLAAETIGSTTSAAGAKTSAAIARPPALPGRIVRDQQRSAGALLLELDLSSADLQPYFGKQLFVFEAAGESDASVARLYSFNLPKEARTENAVVRLAARSLGAVGMGVSVPPAGLSKFEPGTIVIVDPAGFIIDWWPPTYMWEVIQLRVIQNGAANRVLLIPATGTVPQTLAAGRYRLQFALDRWRWSTTEPADSTNHYHAESTLSFEF